MTEPLVSAIIPTYNYARYMADCVGSVLGQSYPNIELIVVDDGGTDDTRQRLEPYMDRIRYIYQENQGVGAARNAGIMAARGIHRPAGRRRHLASAKDRDADEVCSGESESRRGGGAAYAQIQRCLARGDDRLASEGGIVPHRAAGSSCPVFAERGAYPECCLDTVGVFRTKISGADDRDLFVRIAARFPIVLLGLPLVFGREHGLNQSNDPVRMDAADRRMLKDLFDNISALQGRRTASQGIQLHRLHGGGFVCRQGGSEDGAGAMLRSFMLWPFWYERGNLKSPMDRLKILGVILLRMLHLKPPHQTDALAPVQAARRLALTGMAGTETCEAFKGSSRRENGFSGKIFLNG